MPVYPVYAASKGAIEQFTRVLAKDLGTRGITVNTVSPGPVDTELLRASVGDEAIGYIGSLNPFNRIAKPDDIAPVIAFVASPQAGWISGQNIPVNGVSCYGLCSDMVADVEFRLGPFEKYICDERGNYAVALSNVLGLDCICLDEYVKSY
jgi:hypothetical protein